MLNSSPIFCSLLFEDTITRRKYINNHFKAVTETNELINKIRSRKSCHKDKIWVIYGAFFFLHTPFSSCHLFRKKGKNKSVEKKKTNSQTNKNSAVKKFSISRKVFLAQR